jgi:hypothetical protein
VLSSDTGFAGNKRFKSGDVHIKKESRYVKKINQEFLFLK